MDYSRLEQTYGALLIGGFIAAVLSGILSLQCMLYIKFFPQDQLRVKLVVGLVWTLDQLHTILAFLSIWRYLIKGFGDYNELNVISHYLALTIGLTGLITFIVHCFFVHRIHRLSNCNWRLTGIIVILAVGRFCASAVTTAEMIRLGTLAAFNASFRWLFTLGLALSSFEDILIATFMVHSLQSLHNLTSRRTSSGLDHVIARVTLYTLETNSLTGFWTIICMICWLTMPNNFIFMASHFCICKLYGNTLLATLNTRKQLRNHQRRSFSVDLAMSPVARFTRTPVPSTQTEQPFTTKIYIEQTVECSNESYSDCPTPSNTPSSTRNVTS